MSIGFGVVNGEGSGRWFDVGDTDIEPRPGMGTDGSLSRSGRRVWVHRLNWMELKERRVRVPTDTRHLSAR